MLAGVGKGLTPEEVGFPEEISCETLCKNTQENELKRLCEDELARDQNKEKQNRKMFPRGLQHHDKIIARRIMETVNSKKRLQ